MKRRKSKLRTNRHSINTDSWRESVNLLSTIKRPEGGMHLSSTKSSKKEKPSTSRIHKYRIAQSSIQIGGKNNSITNKSEKMGSC